jgi:hypothetical protein
MRFYEWLHQHNADEFFLQYILRTDEVCFKFEGVLNFQNSHFWARDNSHTVRERGRKVCSASGFGLESLGTLSWAPVCYLTADCSTCHDFLETVLKGLLEDVPLAVGQRLWVQHDGTPAHCVKDVRQWLNATYSGRWTGRRGPIAWPPRWLDLNCGRFFLVGTRHIYSVLPRTIGYSVARLQATVTTFDASMLRCIRENSV